MQELITITCSDAEGVRLAKSLGFVQTGHGVYTGPNQGQVNVYPHLRLAEVVLAPVTWLERALGVNNA